MNTFRLIIVLCVLVLPIFALSQVSYVVAPTGNDSSDGTEAHPWRTFQKACNSATAGSTVYFKQGVYNEKTTMNVSGSPEGGYITFRNYGTDTVVLDGTGKTGDQLILIANQSYIRIQGMELRNNLNQTFGSGIWVQGSGSHIEIRKNIIHDMRRISNGDCMALSVYGTSNTSLSHIVIDSNVIYNCEPGHSETIAINGNVDTFWVTNNVVHDVNNIGIVMIGGENTAPSVDVDAARNGFCRKNIVYHSHSLYGGGYAGGIYVDGGRNIIVEQNSSYQNDVGIEIGCENHGRVASGMIVRNNLVFNNDKRGIGVGGYNYPTTGKVTTTSILNNTCFNNDTYATDAGELTVEYTENCVFKNNILYSTTHNRLMETTVGNTNGNIFDYNCWFAPGGNNSATIDYNGTVYTGFDSYRTGEGQDSHSVFGDPLFLSTVLPNPDLHIQSGSPAIDGGDPAFVPDSGATDFENNPRVSGSRVDCGAYEVNQTVLTVPALLSPVYDSTVVSSTPILRWSSSDSGVTYQVQVATDSLFATIFINDSLLTDTTQSVLKTVNGIYFWHVRAERGTAQSHWSPTWRFRYSSVNKWKLISVPVQVSDARTSVLFPHAISKAYAFIPGIGYEQRDTLSNGIGYWLKFGADQTTDITGALVYADTLNLAEGWNLIGSVSEPVSALSVTSQPDDLLSSGFFGYEQGYSNADTIAVGKGYWVKTKGAGKIIINSTFFQLYKK